MPTSSTRLRSELFSQLAEPFIGEELFDLLTDLVFFVKNRRGEYVVVNQTLAERCGRCDKTELLGRRADDLFIPPFGTSYRAQDEAVLTTGQAVLNQLELHFHPSRKRGWCLTNKLPLHGRDRAVIGLVGMSKDLPPGAESGAEYSAVAKVVRQIRENYGGCLRVGEVAAHAGFSNYQLDQRFRKIFGLNPSQFIQKTRVEAALRLLRETDDSIAAVAFSCGYTDQSAFTRKFRQIAGLTPSAYRVACIGADADPTALNLR